MTRTTLLALSLLFAPTLAVASAPKPSVASDEERALFAYDRAAPLDLKTERLSVEDGVEVYEMSFASPKGGRATGRILVPQREGKKAGIVMMHGAPGSAAQLHPRALPFARRGAVVVSVDAPFARRNASAVTFTAADRADQVQLIVDLQRAVDLLLARPDVDPARIAFVGGSYGGAVGALFAGVDARPATYILYVADGGFVSHFTSLDGTPQGPLAELSPEERESWIATLGPVGGMNWVGRARSGSILFQNGREDPLVPPAKAEALHRAAGSSHTVRWYESGHKLPDQAWQDMFRWLHERVGTDAPATRG
ncbi:acetylxylan esterase [Hyalangium rubrum]|uniref:Acetylxylan esterase n=1 Tax=Hyalangium rubrum TaxID=3103134 RepID=A0ABU5GV81_9BACT|nr:acetylxylan esterase [Hyalangium sp. s54d21]MDY7225075.1 acetylxylan esterase [Hyalangium sp. s54d21]